MHSILVSHSPGAPEPMSPRDMNAVLASARSLQRAAQAGATQPLLRGKNLGLLCEANDANADLFRRAASELGAHVAHIRPSLSDLSTPKEVQHTARMLGKLYDAVECQGMAPGLVRQVGDVAGGPGYRARPSPPRPPAPRSGPLPARPSLAPHHSCPVSAPSS